MLSLLPFQVQGAVKVNTRRHRRLALHLLASTLILRLPQIAGAQTSPFLTGANALQTNILAWLTLVAIILVMVLVTQLALQIVEW